MADEKTRVEAGLDKLQNVEFEIGEMPLVLISLLAVLSTAGVTLAGIPGAIVALVGGDVLAGHLDEVFSGKKASLKNQKELIDKMDEVLANQSYTYSDLVLGLAKVYGRFDLQDKSLRWLEHISKKGFAHLNENDRRIIRMLKEIMKEIRQPKPPEVACKNDAPDPPDHFVGRFEECKEILVHLQEKDQVAITAVHGMGGMGKTSLAQYFCHKFSHSYTMILWAGINQAPNLRQIFEAWAKHIPSGFVPAADMDIKLVADKMRYHLEKDVLPVCGRILLVLDNVWQNDESLAAAHLLRTAVPGGTAILMTTRADNAAYQIAGTAHVIPLKALDSDKSQDTLKLQAKGTTDKQRATLAKLMNGHPLALKLAAQKINKYKNSGQVDRLLVRYEEGIKNATLDELLLEDAEVNDSDTIKRHKSLATAFRLTYDGLDERLQKAFRYTGILALETPIHISLLQNLWDVDEDSAEEIALELCSQALLTYDEDHDDDNIYTQHALLRSYARRLLRREAETEDAFRSYLAGVTEQADPFSEIPPEKWGQFDPLIPHLWVTGDDLVEKYKNDPGSWQQEALQFALNTYRYLAHRREALFVDGQLKRDDWLQMGLKAAQALKERQREGLFAHELGLLYDGLGRKQDAIQYYQQALPIVREVGDRGGEASTLNSLGMVYSNIGQKEQALEYYQQALPIFQDVGDRGGEATTLNSLGMVYSNIGQKEQALEYYEQALPIYQDVGDRGGEATTLNNMAGIYFERGEIDKALDYYEQALPIYKEVGDRGGEATTLNNLGMVYDSIGQKEQALSYYQQALPIRREVGNRGGEATTLNNMAGIYFERGEIDKALDMLRQILTVFREVGDRGGEAVICSNIGYVLYQQGKLREAIPYLRRCVELMKAVQHPSLEQDRAFLERVKQAYREQGGEPDDIAALVF